MKRLKLLILAVLVSTPVLYAGALVTNTNQSAAWARVLTRHATYGIDAAYFNPAGLTKLNNGFHFSLSNLTITQSRTVTSDYMYLNGTPKTYEADLMAPIFPSAYAVYNMGKWAFSAGFNIIGGGGSADFETGLSSFEVPISSLPPILHGSLAPLDQAIFDQTGWDPGFSNVGAYDMSSSFKGSSVYYGIQAGATYAINDMISVYLGGRYVMANNDYEGSLTGVTVDAPYGGIQTPGDYLRRVVGTLETLPPSPEMTGAITMLNNNALVLDDLTADAELKASQSGSGFAPIIGVNLHFSDMLNVAVKYEFHTKINLTNDTEVDDVDMFPDGEKVRADLPGTLAVGARVNPIKNLSATVGFNYYQDKSAYYGDSDDSGEQINNETSIDDNGYTYAFSVEYRVLDFLGLSVGYTGGNNGVNDNYQSGITYALKSRTYGGGFFVEVGEMLTFNAGINFTKYDDYSQSLSYALSPTAIVPYTDTYTKETMILAFGVDISF
jgi:long-chain fatty acid transport protein